MTETEVLFVIAIIVVFAVGLHSMAIDNTNRDLQQKCVANTLICHITKFKHTVKKYWNLKMNKNYDVVVDTLEKHIGVLQKMIDKNMRSDMINIMDDIRFEQINQLREAITVWNNRYKRQN